MTNPPIDSLRERKVFALDSFVGPRRNLLAESPEQARLLHLRSVVLAAHEMQAVREVEGLQVAEVSTVFPVADRRARCETALDRIVAEVEQKVRDGAGIVILTDSGLDADHAAVPMALVVGAVHHHLIREGLRSMPTSSARPARSSMSTSLAC